MFKHDLQARSVYRQQHDSIKAHLTIVFAALAVSRWIEHATGWLFGYAANPSTAFCSLASSSSASANVSHST